MITLKDFSDLHYEPFLNADGKMMYRLLEDIRYESSRFNKTVTIKTGFESDGASGPAKDIYSKSWWVHDYLIEYRKWDDGAKCSNLQASYVIHDILMKENRYVRAKLWFVATLVYGEVRDLIK